LSCSLRTRLLASLLGGMMAAVPPVDANAADEGSAVTQGETPTVTSAPSEPSAQAAAQASVAALATTSVEELVSIVRDSIVTIRHTGRDGNEQGLGTGFVIDAGGLIATNLHVIGEARPIQVQLADGSQHQVTEIHASDRSGDLAVIRIAKTGLDPLRLAEPESLADGQEVVTIGNPLGFERSVVTGRVSGQREIDGIEMIQLAMPVEPGNSGGPVLDRQGLVHGVISLKSLVTPNLGFAVGVDRLRTLLDRPNPVLMDRWLTIGALDPLEWTPLGGARWRQRAGRISVSAPGKGFGGRSLCLAVEDPPEDGYEVAVWVQLEDEAGAAGLAFEADGGDRHYGFYPSNGRLRLTRFSGPDVLSWEVLKEQASSAYRVGEWNYLCVRRADTGIVCLVNDEPVFEVEDAQLPAGRAGLVKFRDTDAEFRGFALGSELPEVMPSEETRGRVATLTNNMASGSVLNLPAEMIGSLAAEGPQAVLAVEQRASALAREAEALRLVAAAVHERQTLDALADAVAVPDAEIDLFRAALLIARLDNPEVDVEASCDELKQLAAAVARRVPDDADDAATLAMLNTVLFEELGFHGSRGDFYNRSNSYINEVLDDREGIPITLAVVYMELARELGVKVEGVSFPGHFIVRTDGEDGEPVWIDVFEGGQWLTREDLAKRIADQGMELAERHLAAASSRQILARMLGNLEGIASREQDAPAMLRYLSGILTVTPAATRDRVLRMVTAERLGRREMALADARWLLDEAPEDIDLAQVRQFIERVEARP
jgi:serine protease Do